MKGMQCTSYAKGSNSPTNLVLLFHRRQAGSDHAVILTVGVQLGVLWINNHNSCLAVTHDNPASPDHQLSLTTS